VSTVFFVQIKNTSNQHRSYDNTKSDADPLMNTDHVHKYEQYKNGYETTGKENKILRPESVKLGRLTDPFIDFILHVI
jgi:hypothetical protein